MEYPRHFFWETSGSEWFTGHRWEKTPGNHSDRFFHSISLSSVSGIPPGISCCPSKREVESQVVRVKVKFSSVETAVFPWTLLPWPPVGVTVGRGQDTHVQERFPRNLPFLASRPPGFPFKRESWRLESEGKFHSGAFL